MGMNFLSNGFELGGCTRNKEDVEAFLGKLHCEFSSNAVRGARNESPAAFGAKGFELELEVNEVFSRRRL